MYFNDLLAKQQIEPKTVVMLRHRPKELQLRKVLPWLAVERPKLFNAFQQTHGRKVEASLKKAGYVASFVGHEPGRALFVGLFSIRGTSPLTLEEFWEVPEYIELRDKFGMLGWSEGDNRGPILWFDLELTDFYAPWKGRLVIGWPGIEKNWRRWADSDDFPVLAVHEDSALVAGMPEWNRIALTWEQLGVLPVGWRSALEQWRGIYYIFDASDGKGYVGSAYGSDNLLGRWQNYAASGHGENRLLRERNPRHFSFTILQRLSPDMDAGDVIRLESTWKDRLHTRSPIGLNDN